MAKIGQAAWLCRSHLLGCMITYLEKFHLLLNLCLMLSLFRQAVADPNRRWYTFDTLKRNEWSVMCGPGCKMFLLNPGVFASRDTSSEGGPIPCHSWKSITQYVLAVLIVYNICGAWDVSVLLDCNLLVFRHYCNIRISYDFKNVLGYSKVKTVRVYVWAGLTIIFSFERIFKVKQVVGVYSHQSHDWPRVYFVLFSLNSWVPNFVRTVK